MFSKNLYGAAMLYFNFALKIDDGWAFMKLRWKKPHGEKIFFVMITPNHACFSNLIFKGNIKERKSKLLSP